MRLDFNVLWVDDQPDRVEAQITSIARKMEAEGFRFSAKSCTSVDEARRLVSDNVFTDEVDLVLVDWDLGGGEYGEEAIGAIREHVRYKDVVFYSAMKPAAELRGLVHKNNLEGVFCTSREDLVDELLGVFDSLVKKVLDLDHARGIVMGATSDIDHLANQILQTMHEKSEIAEQKKLCEGIVALIGIRIQQLNASLAKLASSSNFDELCAAHMLFTAYDRLRILSGMLKDGPFKVHADRRPSIISYLNEVIPRRNELGHLVLMPEGKPSAVMTVDGKTVTLEETRELRRKILGLRDDFRSLLDALRTTH